MNFKLRLLALLLAMMMVLSSCELSLEMIKQYLPEDWFTTEPQQTEPTPTEPTQPAPSDPVCTEHVDADGDEKCDVCDADVPATQPPVCEEHKDEDGDEKCDACGADVPKPECTEHVDSDGDEKCDECGAEVKKPHTEHVDSNGDYACDECKTKLWSKADHSITKDEILAQYTLTREEIDYTLDLLDRMVEGAMGSMTIEEVDVLYEEFEGKFYHIAQQMTIASIVYYHNMKDDTASQRHLDTQSMFYEVQDKYTESCRTMYLDSPYSAEFFAGWSQEEIDELLDFDPKTTALKKEVEELQVQFNDLGTYNWDEKSAEIYAQIVIKNNQLAELYGYENYYEYASKNVYGRDYSTEDLATFKEYVIKYIVPRFTRLNNGWQALYDLSTSRRELAIAYLTDPFDSMDKNYLLMYLDSLGDTNMGIAMRDVFENSNCTFSSNANSHPTAFQTHLYEDDKPFCFFGSNGQSSSTMVHEIGHYYADYQNSDLNNYDLCETHSQGNEFLFLQYCKDNLNSKVYNVVRYYNLFNAYYVIVVASVIDDFEQRVYSLDEATLSTMTGADFDAIMDEVLVAYGRDAAWFENNLTDVYSYWRNVAIDNPVYYISYAVSAVAAVEIFSIAETDYDAAMTAYTTLVEGVTAEDGFIEALKKAGLTTPFEEETFTLVAATMKK